MRQAMLEVIFIVDAGDERNSLIAGAESPLAAVGERERTRMSCLGLLGVLFRMALAAGGRTSVLAGCRLEKQAGQYDTANYQINLPLN
jgi:hypothetical protein